MHGEGSYMHAFRGRFALCRIVEAASIHIYPGTAAGACSCTVICRGRRKKNGKYIRVADTQSGPGAGLVCAAARVLPCLIDAAVGRECFIVMTSAALDDR